MCRVVLMVAVPVVAFSSAKRHEDWLWPLLGSNLGCAAVCLQRLLLDGLVERRCLPHLAVTDEVGAHFFAEPSTGQLSTHASPGALGAVSSVGHPEAGLGTGTRG